MFILNHRGGGGGFDGGQDSFLKNENLDAIHVSSMHIILFTTFFCMHLLQRIGCICIYILAYECVFWCVLVYSFMYMLFS